ncbi:TA system VapC family ribonuclease toxin [Luteococcus sp. H138]|uniref:TA system VapC family ribonuclease toxin n=1 Tax=unclassified Luteococcus TaxID=2639923 RepID=UPI00313B3693
MTTVLLDANILIALTVREHDHHERSAAWLSSVPSYAVCPIVEGALVRYLLRLGESTGTISTVLAGIAADPRHHFWEDNLSYSQLDLGRLRGHRQATDAYLVALARHRGARLATLDEGLAAMWQPDAVLIP